VENTGGTGLYVLALVLIGLKLGFALLVGVLVHNSEFRFQWMLRILRLLCQACFGILYIPIIGILALQLTCQLQPTCWSGQQLTSAVVSLALGLPFVLFSFVFIGCFYERDPTADATIGFPTARADMVLHAVKTCLPVHPTPSTQSQQLIDPRLLLSQHMSALVDLRTGYTHTWSWLAFAVSFLLLWLLFFHFFSMFRNTCTPITPF
jgi:hypothetical protein